MCEGTAKARPNGHGLRVAEPVSDLQDEDEEEDEDEPVLIRISRAS